MSIKKGQALALEMIDDLLGGDAAEGSIVGDPADEISKSGPPARPAAPPVLDPTAPLVPPFENDQTLNLNVGSGDTGRAVESGRAAETGRLGETARAAVTDLAPGERKGRPPIPDSRPRTSVGRHEVFRQVGSGSSTEAALAQSESLRIAQGRILDLEHELERLRTQNEELGAAGDTLRRRADELLAQNTKREGDYQNAISLFKQEKEILVAGKEQLRADLLAQRQRGEELELRISTNIQKIRVRERELENRLELVKMEGAALIRSKDEIILELKRQIDQLNLELGNYRNKNQELNRLTLDKQEMLRRTVKALRLALSMLEGEEESKAAPAPVRKAR